MTTNNRQFQTWVGEREGDKEVSHCLTTVLLHLSSQANKGREKEGTEEEEGKKVNTRLQCFVLHGCIRELSDSKPDRLTQVPNTVSGNQSQLRSMLHKHVAGAL